MEIIGNKRIIKYPLMVCQHKIRKICINCTNRKSSMWRYDVHERLYCNTCYGKIKYAGKWKSKIEHDVVSRREYRKIRRAILKQKIRDKLNQQVCVRCGFKDKRALQFDHINGGGNKSRLDHSSTDQTYLSYLLDPALKEKIQVLCANCNWIKKDENNENPRGKRDNR